MTFLTAHHQSTPKDTDSLRIFDALSPFFLHHPEGQMNWSKIPFAHLERDGKLDPDVIGDILIEFDRHIRAMARLGYNAIVLDDLAHLANLAQYPRDLQAKLADYHDLYRELFALIARYDLRVFVATDANFTVNDPTTAGTTSESLLQEAIRTAFDTWPMLDGVTIRIGEADGVDHEGDFRSQVAVKTPTEARQLIQQVLPEFESRGKLLIFRTWTLGAYPVGDLIWNHHTYDDVFGGIDSDNLIVSLKYGDADFFRYLDLNPLFFHGRQKKIIEFQARREYEGMGEYPSFVGFLYEKYIRELRAGQANVVGMFALQGGGWAPFQRTAFSTQASMWNELNAQATVQLFMGTPIDTIIRDFAHDREIANVEEFTRFLRLADSAIESGLYVREMAEQPMYFRRVRIPPLTWVFWTTVSTGGIVSALARSAVRDTDAAISEGYDAVTTVDEMHAIADRLHLGNHGLAFQRETFDLLAQSRELLLGVATPETRRETRDRAEAFAQTYPQTYRFEAPDAPGWIERRAIPKAVPMLVRNRPGYRWQDRLMLTPTASRVQRGVARTQPGMMPGYVDRVGMPLDVLLR